MKLIQKNLKNLGIEIYRFKVLTFGFLCGTIHLKSWNTYFQAGGVVFRLGKSVGDTESTVSSGQKWSFSPVTTFKKAWFYAVL